MENNLNNFKSIKNILNDLVENHYKEFVKALVSIENNIDDENKLNKVYEAFMQSDSTNLINSYFEDILYDISSEEKYKETRLEGIELIDKQKADEILSSDCTSSKYEPLGSFYYKSDDLYVGIDNSNGDAFVEEFDNVDDCIDWLNGRFEILDYLEEQEAKLSIQDRFSKAISEAGKRNSNSTPNNTKISEQQM